jgi:putative metal-binding protein
MSFAFGPFPFARPFAALATLTALAAFVAPASGACPSPAEPASCLSPDPAQWPAPSKPYFMIAVDTSGSMAQNVVPAVTNSCGFGAPGGTDRITHARCALRNTIQAFSGQVHMGLSTFNTVLAGCNPTCYQPPVVFGPPKTGCGSRVIPGDTSLTGCGPEPDPSQPFSADRRGANILVPMQKDDFWSSPSQPSNLAALLSYVDNDCTNNIELYGGGSTASNGMLRDLYRYFSSSWTSTDGLTTYATPLGTAAQGERACRSVNIIYMTDGDEDCDTEIINGKTTPEDAAEKLFAGFTRPGDTIPWRIKTYVINFAGGSQVITDKIAAAGGTGASIFAANEVGLSLALAKIIGGSIKPESCDNADNNCNGCSDEGFTHYCNVQPVAANCCAWNTKAQRDACLTTYTGSITAALPQGDLKLVPCATTADQTCPAQWSCFNPGERCDAVDNNCVSGVDEGITQCGSPLHCPSVEVCDGQDNDCNGIIDENNVCGTCVPSPEICDGCDNDCDGFTDDGITPIPCGLLSPANCVGQLTCKPSVAVPPGGCVAGGGYNACSNSPQPETCNTVDDNCNGQIDENIAPTVCVPAGTPAGLVYGGTSQCKQGQQACGSNACIGFVGPTPEICDGIDNNCDGIVDNAVPNLGQPCGINQLPCKTGSTACVNGAIVCQGAIGPQPEICDGKDNDCDTLIDEAPLSDAPAANATGCWNLPGNCCSFSTLHWCPPVGATCVDDGTLSSPCNNGSIVCGGAAGWTCSNSKVPQAESCDGIDNDCNGTIDDGSFPQVGQPCGSNVGECKPGAIACSAGLLDCVGDTAPTQEQCNGLDDDCDGVIDNGVPVGGPCTPAYDTTVYPGDRSAPPCHPGITVCNGMGGTTCMGGVPPSPEVCDGVDNDCDGAIDETGPGSGVGFDHIDGSQNPAPPPSAAIGDPCGQSEGECKPGTWGCDKGTFVCQGGSSAAVEVCDCLDNDCNGTVDNPNPNNSPALCSGQNDCVKAGGSCQCATKCGSPEFPCPPGQLCDTSAVISGTTTTSPTGYCIPDCKSICGGDCADKTVKDGSGKVLCQPAADSQFSCDKVPTCQCKCQDGCKAPCDGVVCAGGQVCAEAGPKKGTCVDDLNCWNVLCDGCNKACNGGACVDAPCALGTCVITEECKPTPDFMGHTCITSCGGVQCQAGKTCVDGACVDDCFPPCAGSQVCNRTLSPPACVDSKCSASSCPGGAYCDPLTGACGNYPCEDVLCPLGEACDARTGQCAIASASTTATTGAGGSTSVGSTSTGSLTTSSSTGAGGAGGTRGVFGLATGGGGCACEVGPGSTTRGQSGAALAALAIALGCARARRRRRTDPARASRGEGTVSQ